MRYISKHGTPDAADIAKLNDAVRGPHQSDLQIRVADFDTSQPWLQNHVVASTGWKEPRFEIVSGDISETMEPVTRELSLTVISEYWRDPFESLHDISPYRTMLSVARGVIFPQGTVWVPMGVYRVYEVEARGESGGASEITVLAYSLEASIRDARFLQPPIADLAPFGGKTVLREIIKTAINDAFGMTVTIDDSAVPTDKLDFVFNPGTQLWFEKERLDFINTYLQDEGFWGRFDRRGIYEIVPIPSLSDTPIDWIVDSGDDGVLVSLGKRYSRESVYNAVSVTGESADQEVNPWVHTVVAKDIGAKSPTRWDGPFGRVPTFRHGRFFTDPNQVAEYAARELLNLLAPRATVDFAAVPNPLLEAGDMVTISYESGPSEKHTEESHMLASVGIGLGADTSMSTETLGAPAVSEELNP